MSSPVSHEYVMFGGALITCYISGPQGSSTTITTTTTTPPPPPPPPPATTTTTPPPPPAAAATATATATATFPNPLSTIHYLVLSSVLEVMAARASFALTRLTTESMSNHNRWVTAEAQLEQRRAERDAMVRLNKDLLEERKRFKAEQEATMAEAQDPRVRARTAEETLEQNTAKNVALKVCNGLTSKEYLSWFVGSTPGYSQAVIFGTPIPLCSCC